MFDEKVHHMIELALVVSVAELALVAAVIELALVASMALVA